MPSCLGLYVDKRIIKYAKVSKDKKNLKVEAYGVKFYENLEETIEQIIKETFSFQIPICINISDEQYKYSTLLNLLKPKDLEKAIDTEFEYFCSTNSKNKNTLEYRRLISQNTTNNEDRDKLNIIYVYANKITVVERIQLLDAYKIGLISPIALTLPNLNQFASGENSVYVNIEDKTEITTVAQGKIQKIDKIDKGMANILKVIELRENSLSRAYEACKNTTVYTKAGQNLKIDGNEYLEEIILGLSDIIEEVKKVIDNNEIQIDNIYLTGTGIVINNIDLFFQENFMDKKTEILIPYFTEKTNTKINVKDYAEVNSAISLAMQGLEAKQEDVNFSNKGNTMNTLKTILTADVGKGTGKQILKAIDLKGSLQKELDTVEKGMLRLAYIIVFIILFYVGILYFLTTNINTKIDETQAVISDTNQKIAQVSSYKSLVDTRNSEYQDIITQIEQNNSNASEAYTSKMQIPILLNKIMNTIPLGVQLTSIENISGKSIVIQARAEKYDQLGYFKTVLAEEGILNNVTTSKGENVNGVITVTIRGDLPY
jgi:Tfp pilus assembly protein PilN